MQRWPRLGQPPPPDHWSARTPGIAYHLAAGFDDLAEAAGAADGLSLLLKECGAGIGDAEQAGPEQAREWFYQCYARYGGRQLGMPDVVAVGCGIFSFGSGWDAGHRP